MATSLTTLLAPRHYQEEILRQALDRNVIAALDTGSGKTYIAILLMRWITAQASKMKKIIFIVPRVALIMQQADYITMHTALRVASVHGDVARGAEERDKWADTLKEADVLVSTRE
jgi:endoribonuclease Dicer